MKHRILSLLVTLVMVLSLLPVTLVAAEEVITLDIVTHVQYDFLEKLWPYFEAKYPNIKINAQPGQGVDTGVYTALLASEDCPDMVMLGTGASRIPPLYDAGLIEDLTGYYEERGWSERVSPTTLDSLKRIDNGRLLEVSNGMDVFTFKYFISDFEELDLTTPTTYAEFKDILKVLKENGKVPLMTGAMSTTSLGHLYSTFLQSICGYEMVTDLIYGDKAWTDPEPLLAAQEFNSLMQDGYLNANCVALTYPEAAALFASGGASMLLSLQGYLDKYVDDGLDMSNIGSFSLPAYDESQPTMPAAGFAQCWVLPTNAKDKEAALTFLDWVLSDDYTMALNELADIGGWDPGIGASVPSDPSVLASIDHPLVREALAALSTGTGYNLSPYLAGNVKTVMFEELQNMLMGLTTPEELVQKMQDAKLETE